jgi:Membrane carboxypeptidase (penicillin-binding protein)
MTKNEILELYLNKAPFGSNIRGVEAAARAWFNKPAKELSLSEAAFLPVYCEVLHFIVLTGILNGSWH